MSRPNPLQRLNCCKGHASWGEKPNHCHSKGSGSLEKPSSPSPLSHGGLASSIRDYWGGKDTHSQRLPRAGSTRGSSLQLGEELVDLNLDWRNTSDSLFRWWEEKKQQSVAACSMWKILSGRTGAVYMHVSYKIRSRCWGTNQLTWKQESAQNHHGSGCKMPLSLCREGWVSCPQPHASPHVILEPSHTNLKLLATRER